MKRSTITSLILCLALLLLSPQAAFASAKGSGLTLATAALNSVYRALPKEGADKEEAEETAGRGAGGTRASSASSSGATSESSGSGTSSGSSGSGTSSGKDGGEAVIGTPEKSEVRQPARLEAVSFGEGASISTFSPETYGNYVDVVWGTDRLSVRAEASEGAEILFATYAGLEDESILIGPVITEDDSFSFNYHETYRLVIVARYPDDSELELASSYNFLFRDIM